MKSCAFTGHRPRSFAFGSNEEHSDCIKLKTVLREEIMELYKRGYRRFYSGCAVGVDIWAGEAVLELQRDYPDIELFGIIPYEEQAARWTDKDRDRYFSMLSRCTQDIILQPRYSDDCYFKRNRYLVDNADLLLAVYDRESQHRSGTGMTVNYARSKRVPIIYIHPKTFEVTPKLTVL